MKRLDDFLGEVAREMLAHPEWRKGQAYFNTLEKVDPELADKIRGGTADPFYDNRRIMAFVLNVEKAWA